MTTANWQLLPTPSSEQIASLVQQLHINALTATLLIQKGYTDVSAARAFLQPTPDQLHSPLLLHDIIPAVERIQEAVFTGEKILVYGDYDLDGMTSTAIVYDALLTLGADVTAYIPSRFTDGYGPNQAVYERFIADEGVQLIITVDNGVSGHAALTFAAEQGVDVVVTDHHELPDQLPPAFAIVHPRHPAGDYPFGELSGAGVAFKLAQALLADELSDATDFSTELLVEYLDLVALGGVADMVTLTDENRVLVSLGLQQMTRCPRVGLQALLKKAGHAKQQPIISETIGFKIAPRLNAVGRLDDAKLGLDLLLTTDATVASKLVDQVEELNTKRQALVTSIVAEAQAQLADQQDQAITVVYGDDWHEGVLGIVASRLLAQQQHPVIVLTKKDATYKGSGRSCTGVDIYRLLQPFSEQYSHFGGHAGAVGITLPAENLASVTQQWQQAAADAACAAEPLTINLTLPANQINMSTQKALTPLEPFGFGNPAPCFAFEQPAVTDTKTMGADEQHVKLALRNDQTTVEAVGFNQPDWVALAQTECPLRLAATIGLNYFRGRATLQLLLVDMVAAAKVAPTVPPYKQELAQVYRFVAQHPTIDFSQQLPAVAKQLQLTTNFIKVAVQIFIDLDVMRVDNGRVAINPGVARQELTASATYQRLIARQQS